MRCDNLSSLPGVRVLVVEDDQDTSELYAMVLERHGAEVTVVTSVDEALAAVASVPPDVMIVDISLDEGDGLELIQAVRTLGSDTGGNIPALAVSGWVGDGDQEIGIQAGFQVYLTKPVAVETLATVVARLVQEGRGNGRAVSAGTAEARESVASGSSETRGAE